MNVLARLNACLPSIFPKKSKKHRKKRCRLCRFTFQSDTPQSQGWHGFVSLVPLVPRKKLIFSYTGRNMGGITL